MMTSLAASRGSPLVATYAATKAFDLVLAEGLWDEPQAMNLLGTHIIDSRASSAFFGDEMRMHRDVLADAAREGGLKF